MLDAVCWIERPWERTTSWQAGGEAGGQAEGCGGTVANADLT